MENESLHFNILPYHFLASLDNDTVHIRNDLFKRGNLVGGGVDINVL